MNTPVTRTAEQAEIANLKLEVLVLRELVRAVYAREYVRDEKAYLDMMQRAVNAAAKGHRSRPADERTIGLLIRQFVQGIISG